MPSGAASPSLPCTTTSGSGLITSARTAGKQRRDARHPACAGSPFVRSSKHASTPLALIPQHWRSCPRNAARQAPPLPGPAAAWTHPFGRKHWCYRGSVAVEKISVAIDAEVLEAARTAAAGEGLSLSAWLTAAAEERLRATRAERLSKLVGIFADRGNGRSVDEIAAQVRNEEAEAEARAWGSG